MTKDFLQPFFNRSPVDECSRDKRFSGCCFGKARPSIQRL